MPERTPTVDELLAVPLSERPDALEAVVVGEFRAALLMGAGEDLALDKAFFELGLTSLRITDVKRRLEERLGCDISANALFNRPTVRELVAYLMTDVLADVFPRQQATSAAAAGAESDRVFVDDMLKDLYRA
ncbi:acyl carrier protein [Actinokineospora iranica]|uniref:Phosphopantetheine attachment site n=1 Tax=Actinokineospora iranica TaxID=1271860 RepID=A0A1G6SN91_9PSEU|nr:acyl carrier protein [Actinokineospora iranica]SDD18104.1 Phosphopantetheine attachment site [Actinokineospora iranica]